jgi:hypothetical protein
MNTDVNAKGFRCLSSITVDYLRRYIDLSEIHAQSYSAHEACVNSLRKLNDEYRTLIPEHLLKKKLIAGDIWEKISWMSSDPSREFG